MKEDTVSERGDEAAGAEDRVVDLMRALEDSVAAAKAERQRLLVREADQNDSTDDRGEDCCPCIQQVLDEQANDEGLWCQPANIVEAYLQQELRRLHLAIEMHTATHLDGHPGGSET